MNILLVDDEQFQIDTIKRGIRIHGHEVYSARSGEEALNYLEANHDNTTLVITDYFMPGMNGIALLKSIRARYGDLPVILMTAFGDKNLLIEALQNGCDNYLDKPFKPNDIVSQIDEIQLQREKRKRRGQDRDNRKGQSIRDNLQGNQNLIPMPTRFSEQAQPTEEVQLVAAPEIVPEKVSETAIEVVSTAPGTAMPALEPSSVQPIPEMELQDLEDDNPLLKLGGGLDWTVPMVKVVFPIFLFLLMGLTTFFLLVVPMFR